MEDPPLPLIDLWQWLINPRRGCSDPLSPNVIHHSGREVQACLIMFMRERVLWVSIGLFPKRGGGGNQGGCWCELAGWHRFLRARDAARKRLTFSRASMWETRLLTELWGREVPYAMVYWREEMKSKTETETAWIKYTSGACRRVNPMKLRSPVFSRILFSPYFSSEK